ncbi:C-terminal binding protein [Bifidobacterium sp.]|jgi:D-3-phosphoglycerate dehydrogenase|uniref:C-terminal binding protein n=1 Tax=Bifidobacterium sp. TaxID=41200 RepID=UPI0025BC6199|nr:C-terminal binding protein [Bifidobacterium sp.]MCI1634651.1 C-terminal binding protein [Bifidobacterium sp.]
MSTNDLMHISYFNISGGLDYEQSLLESWHMEHLVELHSVTCETPDEETFIAANQKADGVVVEYFNISDSIIDRLPRLKVVGLQSIGTDMVDKRAATAHGIAVTNAPGFCQQEVATTAIAMMLDLNRKISFYDRSVRKGRWEPLDGRMPHRLQGQTVGLVFFGGIPQTMMPVLRALGVNVVVFAPTKTAEFIAGFGAEKVETLAELLKRSDVVSLHTPLITETYHLISEHEFAMMKSSAVIINTARGSIIDEKALVAALQSHVIAGAGIDVIEDEESEQSALKTLDNVVINPHAAFLSQESFYQAREMALRGMVDVLVDHTTPRYLVNTAWNAAQRGDAA